MAFWSAPFHTPLILRLSSVKRWERQRASIPLSQGLHLPKERESVCVCV